MVSLQDMSSLHSPGMVPVCERTGRLCVLPQREIQGNSYVVRSIFFNYEVFSTN